MSEAGVDTAADPAALARVSRYRQVRWVGVGLFLLAAPVLITAIVTYVTGRGPGGLIPLSLFALGLSLGTFGSNDDSAVHGMRELARENVLPTRFQAEWASERKARPARVAAVHDHPKAALILPFAAIAVLSLAVWRVYHAWNP